VIFVQFREPLLEISRRLKTQLIISGAVTGQQRDFVIREFQQSKTPRAIICNMRAGGTGVSLHDEIGLPRQSIMTPGWSSTDLLQALYRIHRRGAQSTAIQHIVFAADTFEERIMQVLEKKMTCLDQILDNDLQFSYNSQ